jgi:hypothetical protein
MIVQTAPADQSHFIVTQVDHAAASGVFAAHFGNETFASLDPAEPLVYVAAHHDDGWVDVDSDPQLDPKTRLPYHLTQTPTRKLVETGNKSPQANQEHHPLSGIISSMHTYGLYHGRYGLSDKIYIDMIDEGFREGVEQMLNTELERQALLKAELVETGHPELAMDNVLFHNYKLLQFFDTLALYIQTVHQDAVEDTTFIHVPRGIDDDVTLEAKHQESGIITFDPWPFNVDRFNVVTTGRYMKPFSPDEAPDDLSDYFYALPLEEQMYTFRRASLV